jgi:uncharacterized protein with HEPN domain
MQPDARDAAYLLDMRNYAREVQLFVTGQTFELFIQDRRLRLAVERGLEIVGEAATRVSSSFRDSILRCRGGR